MLGLKIQNKKTHIKKYCHLETERKKNIPDSCAICSTFFLAIHTEVRCVHVAYVKTKLSQSHWKSSSDSLDCSTQVAARSELLLLLIIYKKGSGSTPTEEVHTALQGWRWSLLLPTGSKCSTYQSVSQKTVYPPPQDILNVLVIL